MKIPQSREDIEAYVSKVMEEINAKDEAIGGAKKPSEKSEKPKIEGTLADRFPVKAVEGGDLRPTPPPSVTPPTVTAEAPAKVDGCASCEVVFDTNNHRELLRAMVIGEALNTPRFKYPFGKRR